MPAASRKIALTDKSLRALKPAGRRLVVWDALLPGMAVRVGNKGTRSFYAVRRRAGQRQPSWVMIGSYPAMSLAEARAKAREALGALIEGRAPPRAEAETGTFRAVAELFIEKHLPKLRTARANEALIRRELIPVLGDKPIGAVRRRDVITLIEAIKDRAAGATGRPESGGEYAARHALAQLRKIFNWAISRDVEGLEANPCVKAGDLLGAARSRDRVLSDDELRTVWRAASVTPYPFGPLIQALLLSGQRLCEIAEASWSEIDGYALVIPGERMKGKASHTVPLAERMSALLETLPHFAAGGFLFTTTAGRRPISGFSKMKARLDRELGPAVAHWTLHDLRRTVRTGLSQVGTSVFVAELVIGHAQSGVHGVYDLHKYDDEKRTALAAWERRLLGIVENVVPLRARA